MKVKFLPILLGISVSLFTDSASAQWMQVGTGNDTIAAGGYDINTLCTDPAGNLYAAGQFLDAGQNQYVSKWNGTTWSELGTGSNALSANGDIYSICSDPSGNIYAAGHFTSSNQGYVAKWNGTGWSQLGSGFGATLVQDIMSIASDASGNIYAAGDIAFLSGSSITYEVMKWNGSSWSVLGGTSNGLHANNVINVITVDAAGNVYATGNFTNGSITTGHPYIAKWNGSSWSEVGAGSGALNIPFGQKANAIAVDGSSNVYIGGTFTDQQGNYYVAKWNGSSWSELGGTSSFGPSVLNNPITSITTDGSGNVYAAGDMLDLNDAHNLVLKWNGSSWSNFGHFDNLAQDNAGIKSLIYSHSLFYVTGANMNTHNSRFVAKYNGQGNNTGIEQPTAVQCMIYPNPASSSLYLLFDRAVSGTLSIADMAGSVVAQQDMSGEQIAVNIGSLSSGIYLATVKTNSGATQTLKFVKQ